MNRLIDVGVLFLFVCSSVTPSIGMVFNDDTTPPVTTHTLDPPEPDGDNGWYISDVIVTLNATDDISGVKEIRYIVDGVGGIILGDIGSFMIIDDGDDIFVEYWAIDNAGNNESKKSFTIDIDQIKPYIDPEGVHWESFQKDCRLWIKFFSNAIDDTSGMDRVEMYIDDEHYKTKDDSGPIYEFYIPWSNKFDYVKFWFYHYDNAGNKVIDKIQGYGWWPPPPNPFIRGIICIPEISEENVTFFALLVICNYGGIHMFKHLSFPNNYMGYIGRFLIRATFIV